MKRIAVMAVCLSMPLTAAAQSNDGPYLSSISGNFLNSTCKANGANREICRAYVVGVADALVAHGQVCRPAGVTQEQLRAVVVAHLDARPADWHNHAFFFVRDALSKAFPCKRTARK